MMHSGKAELSSSNENSLGGNLRGLCDVVQPIQPSVFLAPNAGLAADPGWVEGVEKVLTWHPNSTFFATDYCEEAVLQAKRVIEGIQQSVEGSFTDGAAMLKGQRLR